MVFLWWYSIYMDLKEEFWLGWCINQQNQEKCIVQIGVSVTKVEHLWWLAKKYCRRHITMEANFFNTFSVSTSATVGYPPACWHGGFGKPTSQFFFVIAKTQSFTDCADLKRRVSPHASLTSTHLGVLD